MIIIGVWKKLKQCLNQNQIFLGPSCKFYGTLCLAVKFNPQPMEKIFVCLSKSSFHFWVESLSESRLYPVWTPAAWVLTEVSDYYNFSKYGTANLGWEWWWWNQLIYWNHEHCIGTVLFHICVLLSAKNGISSIKAILGRSTEHWFGGTRGRT